MTAAQILDRQLPPASDVGLLVVVYGCCFEGLGFKALGLCWFGLCGKNETALVWGFEVSLCPSHGFSVPTVSERVWGSEGLLLVLRGMHRP